MAVKPTTLPLWATTGSITVPTSGKQQTGWVVSERPPAQYLNWWQNLSYQWIDFTNNLLSNNAATRAQGNLDLAHPTEASLVPVAKFRDWQDNNRFVIDHNGFPLGQFTHRVEEWKSKPIVKNLNLAGAEGVGGASYNGGWLLSATTDSVIVPMGLPDGAIVKTVKVYTSNTSTNTIFANVESRAKASSGSVPTTGFTDFGVSNSTTGAQILQPINVTSDNHRSIIVDSLSGQNNVRVDISAFVSGTISVHAIEITYLMPPNNWRWSTNNIWDSGSGAGTRNSRPVVKPADSDLNHRSIKLTAGGTGNQANALVVVSENEGTLTDADTFLNASTVIVNDWVVRTGTITDGSNTRDFFIGVEFSSPSFTELGFHSNGANANWRLKKPGASATFTDLGIAIAANTTYRFRLEVYGTTASSSSGNVKVRAYIDGVMLSEQNLAAADVAGVVSRVIKCAATGTSAGPYDFRVGRCNTAWNHTASGDNL